MKQKRKLSSANVIRWIAMIPLALAAFFFKFMMAGYGFTALVLCGIIGVLLFYNLMNSLSRRFPKTVKVIRRTVSICLCAGLLVAAVTEGFIIRASLGDPREHCDYIVVLGAKVRYDAPSVALMERIRGAYDYMSEHPEVIAVVSGGQGPDEPMTEAQCMYEQLVALGIDADRIWLEDQAVSTWANLNYSLDLIESKTGSRPTELGIVSSEYHLLRAGMMALDCGIHPVRIPAHTTHVSQLVNHLMREVAAVWFYLVRGGHYD